MDKQFIYRLQIDSLNIRQVKNLSKILKVESSSNSDKLWSIEIEEKGDEHHFDFIDHFANLIEYNYEKIKSIGIEPDQVSIWVLYQYGDQCNLEFSFNKLKRLGDNGIDLCISCWNNL